MPASLLDSWPVTTVSSTWTVNGGGTYGDPDRVFPLASVTKPLFGLAVLVAVEERTLSLDTLIDPSRVGLVLPHSVTVRQLLSHSSGLAPTESGPHSRPGTRRIYSNYGYEILGLLLAEASGFSAEDYLSAAVTGPLGMPSTRLEGSPAHGATSTVSDLSRFCREVLAPTLVSAETVADAARPQYPSIDGVLPGYGVQRPNPWGLGFEIRGGKDPHWLGPSADPATVGHFGQSGTFLWIDRTSGDYCVTLTDRDFGPWATTAWPDFNETVTPGLTIRP